MENLRDFIIESIETDSIFEYVRSGGYGIHRLPPDHSFDSMVDWLESIGFEHITGRVTVSDLENGKCYWAGYSKLYESKKIMVWINRGKEMYTFEMVYRNGDNEPSKIFVEKDGSSYIVGKTNDEIIEFMSGCVL